MEKHIEKLLKRNEHARALVDAGYTIAQAQGPDYDGDGNEIVYLDRAGKAVKNPKIAWAIEGNNESFYVIDDDDEGWHFAAHLDRMEGARRLAANPEMDPLERDEMFIDTAHALGQITKAEAEEAKERVRRSSEEGDRTSG